MIKNISEKITVLSAMWYSLLIDHHKDKDCHFYIEKICPQQTWSYGEEIFAGKSYFCVRHYGYLVGDIEEVFNTYQEAQEYLYKKLIEIIDNECDYWLRACVSFNDDNHKIALENKSLFLEIKEKLKGYKL